MCSAHADLGWPKLGTSPSPTTLCHRACVSNRFPCRPVLIRIKHCLGNSPPKSQPCCSALDRDQCAPIAVCLSWFRERGLPMSMVNYTRWFREIRLSDVALAGGKNASLGELYSALSQEGVRVPNGFVL